MPPEFPLLPWGDGGDGDEDMGMRMIILDALLMEVKH